MTEKSKRGRPQNDPESTRTQLLETAAVLFNRVSYFDTNSNKIAREAGFAPATFYRHFEDKKEIFLGAYSYWVNVNWEALEALDDLGRPAREKADILIEHHHRWKGYRKNLYALAAIDEDAHSFIRAERERQIDRLMARITLQGISISRASALFSFFSIERAINAIVDGDVAVLGIDEAEFLDCVVAEIAYLESGRRQYTRK